MLDKISPNLKPRDGSWYYQKHSALAGFDEVIAKGRKVRRARESDEAKAVDGGKIVETEVKEIERNKALLQEAEGVEMIEDLAGK